MEQYRIEIENGLMRYVVIEEALPSGILEIPYLPKDSDLSIVCRLGDPDLLNCSVFRSAKGSGGLFVMREGENPLFVAKAASNLAYSLAMGHFGKLVADARYACDIFLNLEDPDE